MRKSITKISFAGLICGMINGIFGAGGGMVLVPLLRKNTNLSEAEMFPSSICIMLPICIVTLCIYGSQTPLPWPEALPYLIGSAIGGLLAGKLSGRIPVLWLHRILGGLIIWGGIRYLW